MQDRQAALDAQLARLKAQLFDRSFDEITPEGIQDMLREFITDDLGLYAGEGGLINIILAPGAYVFWEALQVLRAQKGIAFPDADGGPYLQAAAAAVGIYPKAGVRATVTLAFTGAAGTVVPQATRCVTGDGLGFVTDTSLTLDSDGAGTVQATADEVGTAYNVAAGEIVTTQEAVTGVTGLINPVAATGGTAPESDAALYQRLDEYRKQPATSGNEVQYRQWALEVNGIGAASVIRCWDGPGTVKVVIADMALRPVDAAVCAAVKAHIDALRPITAEVTVVSASGVGVEIAATVVIDGTVSLPTIKAGFTERCAAYIGSLAFRAGAKVVYHRVAELLMSQAGVVDFTMLTVGGGTANVPLDFDEVPLLGAVTLEVAANGA